MTDYNELDELRRKYQNSAEILATDLAIMVENGDVAIPDDKPIAQALAQFRAARAAYLSDEVEK